jgi:hypothetical protein
MRMISSPLATPARSAGEPGSTVSTVGFSAKRKTSPPDRPASALMVAENVMPM